MFRRVVRSFLEGEDVRFRLLRKGYLIKTRVYLSSIVLFFFRRFLYCFLGDEKVFKEIFFFYNKDVLVDLEFFFSFCRFVFLGNF